MTDQPTLTDGTVVLRPWHDSDVPAAVAGHDELIAYWFGFPTTTPPPESMQGAIDRWRAGFAAGTVAAFAIEVDGRLVGCCDVRHSNGTGEASWALYAGHRGQGFATRAVRALVDWALGDTGDGGLGLSRVEAKVEPGNESSLRVATRSGLRREGLRRVAPGTGDRAATEEYVVLARLASDPPLTEPAAFRSLLNSFLPRKRAISQMLVRDADGPDARVLLCRLTYKNDWDLPGGVVEVGESPQLAATREVTEELALDLPAGRLLLTDWLPPWGGWDDALCLVFDGGVHPASIVDQIVPQAREIREAAFLDAGEISERCADFTARRITAALDNLGAGPAYTESGR